MKNERNLKRFFAVFLTLVMVVSLLPAVALAIGGDGESVTTEVWISYQAEGSFAIPKQQVTVSSDLSDAYDYADEVVDAVSTLDVLIRAHQVYYTSVMGEYEEDLFSEWLSLGALAINSSGWITTTFEGNSNFSVLVDGAMPVDKSVEYPAGYGSPASYGALTIAQTSVDSGNYVEFFHYQDTSSLDYYTWIEDADGKMDGLVADIGEAMPLSIKGYSAAYYGAAIDDDYRNGEEIIDYGLCEDLPVVLLDASTGAVIDDDFAVVDEDGNFTVSFDTAGTYILSVMGDSYVDIISPWLVVTVQAGEPARAAPHGYLGSVTLRRASNLDTRPPLMIDPASGELVEFAFDPAVTEYDLVYPLSSTYLGSAVVFTATLADTSATGLYGRFFEIGAESSRSLIAPSTSASFNPISNFPSGIWNTVSGTKYATNVFIPASLTVASAEPRTIVLQIGEYDNSGAVKYNSKDPVPDYTDMDEYTFRIRRQANATGFAVYREVGGAALPGSAFNVTSDIYEYLAIAQGIQATDTVYVHVNQPAAAVDTQLYFQSPGGVWVKGVNKDGAVLTSISSVANPYKLDLTGYSLDAESGAYNIPVKIVYEGEGCGVDSFEYTLKITPFDCSVVISGQPAQADGTFEKDEAPTYTVTVAPVQGENAPQGELSYQWYGNRSDNLGQPIPGATEASFTPTGFFSGTTYFTCRVTRTVEDAAFTADSNRVNMTLALTYLSPVRFRETPAPAAGFKYVCEAGQDPGTVSYNYWNADRLTTLDGAVTSVDVYIRPVGSTERGEKVGSGGGSSEGSTSSAFGSRYCICTALFPGYAQAGEYEYYILITAEKEGFEPVYTASEPIRVTVTPSQVLARLDGEGDEESPYLIKNAEDLNSICALVNAGASLTGVYLKLTDNITLPAGWTPIGALKPGAASPGEGVNINPFSGILDCDGKTITVPYGGKPLFGYVRAATVKNLNIYGAYIDGCGLVNNYTMDYGAGGNYMGVGKHPTIDIENVTIKSGTTVKHSGLLGGFASGANVVNITGCTVEDGVIIGWNKDTNEPSNTTEIGSFGGSFNGAVLNSVSYATVYGNNYVGGLIGAKGQSVGPCDVFNSEFHGEVTAAGNYAGGIVGGGYSAPSAPNTPCVVIENCYVTGDITGNDRVGGIFGGEPISEQCWSNGIGYIRNNHFAGTINSADGAQFVGGIIGYMHSLDRYNIISNNYYLEGKDAVNGIGGANSIDTSFEAPAGVAGENHRYTTTYCRDDDPLGADADKLAKSVTAEYLAGAGIVEALNSGTGSWQNWIKDDDKGYPVHDLSATAVIYKLAVEGDYKSIYYIGDSFDATGIVVTAYHTGGTEVTLSGDDVEFSGFDSGSIGDKFITVTYGDVSCEFLVNVMKKPGTPAADNTISVRVALIGSSKSLGGDIDLADGDYDGAAYELWIPMDSYKLENGTTLLELFVQILDEAGFTYNIKSMNNYVDWISSPYGVKMWEFTNGPRSGWMYTVGEKASGSDGMHPNLGLREYVLKDGDVVIWHYVNDYAYEVRDWYDEELPSYATDDYNFYDKWLEALATDGNSNISPGGNAANTTTVAPKVTASNGAASASVKASDMTAAIADAMDKDNAAIVIAPEITGEAKKVSVEIPKTSLSSIASDTNADLKVETPVGSVTILNSVLSSIAAQASGDAVIVSLEEVKTSGLTTAQQAAVGDDPVYDISIMSGGTHISSFGGGSVTISLPYTLKSGEDPANVTVWYLSDAGELERMISSYDAATGMATFTTAHLSHYVVGYGEWSNPFVDVSSADWFYEAVKFAVLNELFNGTTAATFSPSDDMTRAMLVTVLYRLAGEPSVSGTSGFSDVRSDQWYTDAVIWASANNIVTGYGGGLLGTDDSVTREQMAVILYNYAKYKDCDVTKTADLSDYTDASNISSWALIAIKWANAEGLITGTTTTTLSPTGTATRAQVATILMRFVENAAK